MVSSHTQARGEASRQLRRQSKAIPDTPSPDVPSPRLGNQEISPCPRLRSRFLARLSCSHPLPGLSEPAGAALTVSSQRTTTALARASSLLSRTTAGAFEPVSCSLIPAVFSTRPPQQPSQKGGPAARKPRAASVLTLEEAMPSTGLGPTGLAPWVCHPRPRPHPPLGLSPSPGSLFLLSPFKEARGVPSS